MIEPNPPHDPLPYSAPVPSALPTAVASAEPPNTVRPIRVVGSVTRWLILATAGVALVGLLNDAWGIGVIQAFETGSIDAGLLDLYDAIAIAPVILHSVGLLAAAVLWVIWQYHAAASLPPGSLARSPGWHVGSWFVPVVNYWFPFQNIADLARASRARLSGGVRGAWWAAWIAGALCNMITSVLYDRAETLSELPVAMAAAIVTDLLLIISAVLAWIIVARITDAIDPRVQRPAR